MDISNAGEGEHPVLKFEMCAEPAENRNHQGGQDATIPVVAATSKTPVPKETTSNHFVIAGEL
jgi:hypothetical protein